MNIAVVLLLLRDHLQRARDLLEGRVHQEAVLRPECGELLVVLHEVLQRAYPCHHDVGLPD